ncbi:MAG: hypothetical protein LBK41_01970 [Clostridiales bacterium]|jgi:hypothetical protein|nr:hypothetical protein [Clostridiales bacterium]
MRGFDFMPIPFPGADTIFMFSRDGNSLERLSEPGGNINEKNTRTQKISEKFRPRKRILVITENGRAL